jgi:aminoglycoside phosphotransferase (APT) family kinase protein
MEERDQAKSASGISHNRQMGNGREDREQEGTRSDSVRAMSSAVAPDDIVQTLAQARENPRPPLLVLDPLREFLDAHGLGDGDLEASPIGEGHSNVTYLIRRADGSELVLRRPPRPPLPPSAHDVLREARLLRALHGTTARVPTVLAVEDDPATIGCPFYVMERVEGEAIVFTLPPALDAPAERRRIAEELIDALVEIHAVDWRAAGLEDFGKPTGYLERQLRRFGGLWEINKTREIPAVERVAGWLTEHLPESGPATIVHGDYRLGNTMFATGAPARLTAVLDWEMATIGDPLADLGYMCMVWGQADDPPGGIGDSLGAVTKAEGFPTRAELIERYEAHSGRSMSDLRWYVTLAVWKMTVFMEGNYKRALAGATDDPYLKHFGEGVLQLAAHAEEVTRGE